MSDYQSGISDAERTMGRPATKPGHEKKARSRYFIEAVDRGLALLSQFDVEHPTLTLAEIARRTGSVPSTALRLLQTLVDLDYLEELPESGRYRPSVAALRLGHVALAASPLRATAAPILDRLHRETGESVSLAVLVGADAVVVATRSEPADAFSIRIRPGNRFPTYCTAIGKALLAPLKPEAVRRRLSPADFRKLGPNTITSMKQLEASLDAVRAAGYALQDEELAAGMRSVAAPVLRGPGEVAASVGLVLAAARVPIERVRREFAPVVVGAAAELSAKLRAGA